MFHKKPVIAGVAATALVTMIGLAFAQSPNTPNTPPAAAQTKAPSGKDRTAKEAEFAKADADHDGKLSKKELSAMPDMLAKFESLDKNKDGKLSLQEFVTGS